MLCTSGQGTGTLLLIGGACLGGNALHFLFLSSKHTVKQKLEAGYLSADVDWKPHSSYQLLQPQARPREQRRVPGADPQWLPCSEKVGCPG